MRAGRRGLRLRGFLPSAGELAVFCRPVVTAPGLVRRDGSVAAGGWLPDFVRLARLVARLEALGHAVTLGKAA